MSFFVVVVGQSRSCDAKMCVHHQDTFDVLSEQGAMDVLVREDGDD
jgi:hypothetical protein